MEKEPLLKNNSGIMQYDEKYQSALTGDELDAIITKDIKGQNNLTWNLFIAILACIIGSSFQMGYNMGVINAPTHVIQSFFNESYHYRHGKDIILVTNNNSVQIHNNTLSTGYISSSTMTVLWAFTASANAIGGAFGILPIGFLSNKYGRKIILLWNNLINLIGTCMMVFSKYAKSYELFIGGRLVNGFSCGFSSVLGPIYLSEIAPVAVRGFVGTFIQIAITFGVLVSNALGIADVLGTPDLWHLLFAVNGVCIIWQTATLSCCPETPRHLMLNKGDEVEAEKSLIWLRGRCDVIDEIEEMKREKELMASCPKFTITDLFRHKYLRLALTIGVILHLTQQLCGINAVTFYSTSIFEDAGLSPSSAQYATLGSGAINVMMAFISAFIIDKVGRRTLQLVGVAGLFLSSLTLSISVVLHKQDGLRWLAYISVVAVMLYMVSFSLGPGGMPWIIMAELFSQGPRATAVSVCVMVNTLSNITVGVLYPILNNQVLYEYSFVPFVVLLFFFWIFAFIKMPETKGKTIEEITAQFQSMANEKDKISVQDKNHSETSRI